MTSTAFSNYWLRAMPPRMKEVGDYKRVRDIAQRAFEAGRKHEVNKQRHIAAIRKIIDQE